jgi:3-dehydroquinate synthase
METRAVAVRTPSGTYDVVIGSSLMAALGGLLRPLTDARKYAIITDANVAPLFADTVETSLRAQGFECARLVVPPGEATKSWSQAGELLERVASEGLDRRDGVIALGGGVIGDLAGFVAATYLRGVDFVQVPTTLLAQVDSSVGGKTGVDLRAGKNLAGAFKQPILVTADTESVRSLSPSEWASGLAEVAKSAVIEGEEFLGWIESRSEGLADRDAQVVSEAVRRCVEFKSRVVSADEREEGVRECLNYGHTLGHAIENVAGYGTVPHGVAVAEGMRFAAEMAVRVCGADPNFVERQARVLDKLGLRTLTQRLDAKEILRAMHSDKKSRGGVVRFVLPEQPGVWSCRAVDDGTIEESLEVWASSKGRS